MLFGHEKHENVMEMFLRFGEIKEKLVFVHVCHKHVFLFLEENREYCLYFLHDVIFGKVLLENYYFKKRRNVCFFEIIIYIERV